MTGGGLSVDGKEWLAGKNPAFLMPEGALSLIFCAKLCAALKKAGLLGQVPRQVWKKKWVAHCKAAGQGRQVLNYLGRYIFPWLLATVGWSALRMVRSPFASSQSQPATAPREAHRRGVYPALLQHVLPRGCAKVRYYGIWSPACREQLEQARTLLSTSTTTNAGRLGS